MAIDVRLAANLSKEACTNFSLSLSKAEVASSKSKIVGSLRKALAMANLCFSPPDTGSSLVPTFCSPPSVVAFSALSSFFFLHILDLFFYQHQELDSFFLW